MTCILGGTGPVGDASPADWVREALPAWTVPHLVGQLMPSGYEAYARILHPAWNNSSRVRWADVARWSGRVVHPEAQFRSLCTPAPGCGMGPQPWKENGEPQQGALPVGETDFLAGLLSGFTNSGQWWFGLWAGFGFLEVPQEMRGSAQLHVPQRDYLLYRGNAFSPRCFWFDPWWQSPNLWWPDDRAWFVHTEIDLDSTYIGGTKACIDALVSSPVFEAVRVTLDDCIEYAADQINADP